VFCVFIIFAAMKRHLPIGLLLLLAFAVCTSCHNDAVETRHGTSLPTASPELQAIDSLMWQRPDSALAVLLDYLDTDGRDAARHVSTDETFDRHYAHLLLAELLYKNDYAQTNRPELQQAVSYFDSLVRLASPRPPFKGVRGIQRTHSSDYDRLYFLSARAHYINGVGYYENDSAVEACKEYLKALEIMDERFGEKELVGKKARFMAMTYTRLTELFSDFYLHEQAVYFGKLSLDYYQKYNAESWHIAWVLEEIGSHYHMLDNYDSAGCYYQKAFHTLEDTNSLSFRDISTHQAFLNYNMGKNADTALHQLFEILSYSESEKESLSRYAIVGEIFYNEKQYDSAKVYLNKVFHETSAIGSKKQAAEWLVEICKAQGKDNETHEYADFLVPFANFNENQSVQESQMTALYQEYEQKRIDLQVRQKITKNQRTANKAIGLLLGIIAVVAVLYLVNKKRHSNVKKQKEETEKRLEVERQAHKMEQAALAGRLRKSNDALVIQKEEKENLLKTLQAYQKQLRWNSLNDFMNEDICKEILSLLNNKEIKRESKVGYYPELQLSRSQLSCLDVAVEKHFGGFSKILTDLSPKISREELSQCWLYLLDLEDVQIAHLLSCDYSTIKKRSKKMKSNFGIEKDPRQFIREYVL
jgi:tetratricopeptide (TPR) repeat protein